MVIHEQSLALDRFSHLFQGVRAKTSSLADGLSDADATVQSMEDASPAKWHLAHTTWFFETFVLVPYADNYSVFDEHYNFLFNSYYEAVGARHARPHRGMLTRPGLGDVMQYREHVNSAMMRFLNGDVPEEILRIVELGINHEEQHQELFLTDILHLFAQNPLAPAFRAEAPENLEIVSEGEQWAKYAGGILSIGCDDGAFCFDCEGPAHEVILRPFQLARRAVTNGDWISFIQEGGYETPSLWLSDGWQIVQEEDWKAPLYWQQADDGWQAMSLHGMRAIRRNDPVCHISYYEADAFARWADARLPTETEWEVASQDASLDGNFLDTDLLRPSHQVLEKGQSPVGMFGDVWEWTASSYSPYPGYKTLPGAIGEYNGKFMSGQMVLRGGSCVTPARHIRRTYRNFFHPQKRWQYSGVRLARDC